MTRSVLLVDDNKSVIEILRALLQRNGYAVHAALNAADAMKELGEHKVDLIILDVMMPEVDGFELGKRIKDNEELRDIPIIYLTALDALEDEFEGFMSGAVDYMTKPFKARELLDKIERVLDFKETGLPLVMRRGLSFEVAKVLVLTNNETRREQIVDLLASEGYDATGKSAAPGALAELDNHPYHLLIAQVGVQGITSEAVVRFLKSFRLGLPLILIHEKGVTIGADEKSRAFSILRLPIEADELAAACRRAIATYSGA